MEVETIYQRARLDESKKAGTGKRLNEAQK